MEEEEWQLLGSGAQGAAAADEEWVLPATIDSDKPGFARWADTLSTRDVAAVDNACIGKWLPLEQAVELTQQRGKRFSTTGFSQGGLRMLYPEEALFLLDEGGLYLQRPPPKRGFKAAAAASAAAEVAKRQRREAAAAEAKATDAAAAGSVAAGAEAADGAAAATTLGAAADSAAPEAQGANEIVAAVAGAAAQSETAALTDAAPADGAGSGGTIAPGDGAPTVDGVVAAAASPCPPADTSSAAPAAAAARPPAAAPARDLMSLPAAYELLARYCNMAHFMVYSQLRSAGLVVYRHRAYAHVSGGDAAALKPEVVQLALPTAGPERVLEPLFDVYARDGITTFKPSAPGAPDFYVLVADVNEAPPTARQIADLQRRLAAHMQAARKAQVLKVGERADVALGPSANVPQIKYAIASHTTVTFYSVNESV